MVLDEIKAQLTARLKDRNILVDEFNIVNFEFSKNFNDAIGAKVAAEQQALAAKNKLEQIKFEKWNGTLPQVTGGAVPFINLPQ